MVAALRRQRTDPGIDLMSEALKFCRARDHRMLAQASTTALPFDDTVFDLVTSFDVLPQLPLRGADQEALREMARVLKPGGIIFVRVAAYPWLRSGHDEALQTHERYHLGTLCERVEQAGFRVLRATSANSFLLPDSRLQTAGIETTWYSWMTAPTLSRFRRGCSG